MSDCKLKVYVTSYSEEVTGSNNHVSVEWPDGRKVAFVDDCGLFQEKEHNHLNSEKFPFNPENILFAIATHSHTDHIGRFPYLTKSGFSGKIYTSYETAQMFPVVLTETASRLEDDFRVELKRYKDSKLRARELKLAQKGRGRKDKPRHCKKKHKAKKDAKPLHMPQLLFEKSDIDKVVKNIVAKELYQTFSPCEGIEITFYPNAHILGAVLTVCRIFDANEEIYLLFTGDLGLENPVTNGVTDIPKEIADKIDIVVCESTYGSAEEVKKIEKQRAKHMEIISEVAKKKGTIMYMSNSLERPLRVGVDLKAMQTESEISDKLKDFNIYFDSTFGIKCLNKYTKLIGRDYLPDNFTVIDKTSREQTIMTPGPKMIICTSPRFYQGSFMNYGKRMLENPNVTLIFVAYVPEEVRNIIQLPIGSEIDFMGEKVKLKCKRYQFGYYSSHVSTAEMDSFLKQFVNAKVLLFNHGTSDSKVNYVARYKTCNNTTHSLLYGRTVMITSDGIRKYF